MTDREEALTAIVQEVIDHIPRYPPQYTEEGAFYCTCAEEWSVAHVVEEAGPMINRIIAGEVTKPLFNE